MTDPTNPPEPRRAKIISQWPATVEKDEKASAEYGEDFYGTSCPAPPATERPE